MIYLLHGEDRFAQSELEGRIVDELVDPAWRSLNLAYLDGSTTSIAELSAATKAAPFFGNRLVIVRNCPWFNPVARKEPAGDSNQGGGQFDAAGLVALIAEGLPDCCNLMLVVPRRVSAQLNTTKAALGAQARGSLRMTEFPGPDPYKPERTVHWALQHADSLGSKLDSGAAALLVEKLGQDKQLLDQEIRKLVCYAAGRAIVPEDVEVLSPAGESNVFEMLEAVAKRNLVAAVASIRKILLNDHALRVLATVSTAVRTWLQEKAMHGRRLSPEQIGQAIRRHPFRVKKDLELLSTWSEALLLLAVELVAEAEAAIKAGAPDTLILERMLAQLVAAEDAARLYNITMH